MCQTVAEQYFPLPKIAEISNSGFTKIIKNDFKSFGKRGQRAETVSE